jgi:hypothetical protein
MGRAALGISRVELDAARMEILRRRVTTFALVLGLLVVALAGVQALVAYRVLDLAVSVKSVGRIAVSALMGVVLIALPRLRRRRLRRLSLRRLVRRTNVLVLLAVISQLQGASVIAQGLTEALRQVGFTGNLGPMLPLAVFMACVHTAATLIVPWTVLEACIAPVTLAALNLSASLAFANDSPEFRVLGLVLSLASGLPGIAVAAFRSGELASMLALRRYTEVSRELATARRIHERLFPGGIAAGPVQMSFRYEPMRQIGGDYLDTVRHADGSLSIAVIDVTGHGISAAMAVNRLHGELKRIFAQRDDVGPAEVIEALNEYVCLTLADEEVFATAAAVRIEADGRVTISSAGHPPALIHRPAGGITRIDPTAMMLGVMEAPAYTGGTATERLAHGDVLVLYTDGALECHDVAGNQLGIAGLEEALRARAPAGATGAIACVFDAVQAHRAGPPEDDTLVVAIEYAGP